LVRICHCFLKNKLKYLILAMIDNGMGPTHLTNFLADLNIPGLAYTTIQRHENIVGEALKREADKSMCAAVSQEKHLTW